MSRDYEDLTPEARDERDAFEREYGRSGTRSKRSKPLKI